MSPTIDPLPKTIKSLRIKRGITVAEMVIQAKLAANEKEQQNLIVEFEKYENGEKSNLGLHNIMPLSKFFRVSDKRFYADDFDIEKDILPVKKFHAFPPQSFLEVQEYFKVFFNADGYGDNYSTVANLIYELAERYHVHPKEITFACLMALYDVGYDDYQGEGIPFGLNRRLNGETPEEDVEFTDQDLEYLRRHMQKAKKRREDG